MSLLLVAPVLMTWGAHPRRLLHVRLAYLVFPFVLAISVRLDQRLTTAGVLGLAAPAIRGTAEG